MRFATVLVGPVDAHDITVEAFLRAAPALDGDTVAMPRAYLMRAVANRANDLHRARERRW
jgi:RNA polymerase sigma-70 factor (ECF subfamily)